MKTPAGIDIQGCLLLPPASISQTEFLGLALSRLATTHPDDPAPMIM